MPAALLNPESFRRAVMALIEQADAHGRAEDLDRIALHVEKANHPAEVTRLAAFLFLVDQEFLLPLQEAIDGHRRWCEKKGTPIEDDALFSLLRGFYLEARGRG